MAFVPRFLGAVFCAVGALSGLPNALAQTGEPAGVTIEPAPAEAGSVMFVSVIVEDERIEVRQTRGTSGDILFDSRPIIEHLRGEITLDGTLFQVKRYHDGARIELDMADGKVSANGQVLGAIPGWDARDAADTWLDANAISIFTGTTVSQAEGGVTKFTLDERLRPQFDLEIEVNGERLAFVEVEARTIGPVLLLPLEPIVDALGHALTRSEDGLTVTVERIQDGARIALDTSTGLVTVNDRVVGVSPNMSYAEPDDLLLPATAVETLTGTNIALPAGSSTVEINIDPRLGGGAMPEALVNDLVEDAPFTIEAAQYQLSDTGPATVDLFGHTGAYNFAGRVRTANGVIEEGGLRPARIGADIQSLKGWTGSVGDTNPDGRPLAGVDRNAIRGVAWQKKRDNGTFVSAAAGLVPTGNDDGVPTYGGFTAGARLIQPDKGRELALAAVQDNGGGSSLVASYQKRVERSLPDGETRGLTDAFLSADLGVLSGSSEGAGLRGPVHPKVISDLIERFDQIFLPNGVSDAGARHPVGTASGSTTACVIYKVDFIS